MFFDRYTKKYVKKDKSKKYKRQNKHMYLYLKGEKIKDNQVLIESNCKDCNIEI